jgi:hypothetical protein
MKTNMLIFGFKESDIPSQKALRQEESDQVKNVLEVINAKADFHILH